MKNVAPVYKFTDKRNFFSYTPTSLARDAFQVNWDRKVLEYNDWFWIGATALYYTSSDSSNLCTGYGFGLNLRYYLDRKNKIYAQGAATVTFLSYDEVPYNGYITQLNRLMLDFSVGYMCKIYKELYVDFYAGMGIRSVDGDKTIQDKKIYSNSNKDPNFLGITPIVGVRIGVML